MEEDECPLCQSKSILKHEDLKLLGGKMIIKDTPYFECSKCGEKFSTSGQMQELSDIINVKRKEFVFKRPLINAGRSLAITIPSDIVSSYSLKKGKIISIIPESKDRLILKLS